MATAPGQKPLTQTVSQRQSVTGSGCRVAKAVSGYGALQSCLARRRQAVFDAFQQVLRHRTPKACQPAVYSGVRTPVPRRRPVAQRLAVKCPYPHLIVGTGAESRDRRRGGGAIVLPIPPGTPGAMAILDIVVRQRRAAVPGWCLPAHPQTRA